MKIQYPMTILSKKTYNTIPPTPKYSCKALIFVTIYDIMNHE